MASIATHISIFFFLALLSSLHIHARDSQFFNKMPSNNNVVNKEQTTLIPQEQQPSFIPETENGYGLYGREPTTTAAANGEEQEQIPNKKYLPKNYNPVAYVTVPKDNTDGHESSSTTSAAAVKGGSNSNNFYAKQQSTMPTDTFMESGFSTTKDNYYSRREERYPSTTTTAGGGGDNQYNYYNGGNANGFHQRQGMSDTRFVENGKYYYDTQAEKYARNPYENSRNEFGNNYNNNNNFMENSFQNDEEFQDEDDLP